MSDRCSWHGRWTHKRAGGQSLVEMALVIPILVMLLTGVFEFGLLLYAHVQVSNAAREAGRAASLYRSTRYITVDGNNAPSCEGSIDGWSLNETLQQAIVYRALDNQGCPTTAGAIQSTSLGWLPTTPPAPDTIQVTVVNVEDTSFWPTGASTQVNGNIMPRPGTQATVTLRYPYQLQVISNFVSVLSNPIWIEKSVRVEFQQ
jgi:Flp pilus assembly protein TadG